MAQRMRRVRIVAALAGALGVAAGAEVRAHEIGTTQVRATFDAARYDVVIVTDAASLLDRLAPEGDASALDAAALRAGLAAHERRFRTGIAIAFGGTPVVPAITWRVGPPASEAGASLAEIHLTGAVPSSAGPFTWHYGWTFATYALVAHTSGGGADVTAWLEGDETSRPIPLGDAAPAVSRFALGCRYVALGFTHIVPHGLDHVLFVLGIFLLCRRWRPLLAQVSAFTVAHSITLGLTMYGVVAVPPALVEPLIAVSIAYVAVENVLWPGVGRRRVALVFAFGLLHGLGFAGALRGVGLPGGEFATALVGFNLGVEAGQLAVIALAFGLIGSWSRHRVWYRPRVVIPASLVIALAGLYWTVERLIPLV